jgi:DNA-binding XRE family transcriptional regulator
MNRKPASIPWKESKARMMKDPEFAREYEALAPEYELAQMIIDARIERGMTQEELARLVGTRQSNISRIERGQQNISIGLMSKVARGLGKKLQVSIQ